MAEDTELLAQIEALKARVAELERKGKPSAPMKADPAPLPSHLWRGFALSHAVSPSTSQGISPRIGNAGDQEAWACASVNLAMVMWLTPNSLAIAVRVSPAARRRKASAR